MSSHKTTEQPGDSGNTPLTPALERQRQMDKGQPALKFQYSRGYTEKSYLREKDKQKKKKNPNLMMLLFCDEVMIGNSQKR